MIAHRILRQTAVRFLLCCAAVLFIASAASAEERTLVFSPPDWDVGTVSVGARIDLTLVVRNTGATAVSVSLIPTCGCLSAAPSRLHVRPGANEKILLTFRPDAGPAGEIKESFLIQTDVKGQEWQYYWVHGRAAVSFSDKTR